MENTIIESLAKELNIRKTQIENTLKMLEEGNTVPFIARYRKEATSGLDEEQILTIHKEYQYELNLNERKEAVLSLIEKQGKLTAEITSAIKACKKLSEVEDLYKPYKQKKKTRAAVAIKNGLEPLSNWLLSLPKEGDVLSEASKYLNENVKTIIDALSGAKDIVAEVVSDDAKLRWNFKDIINSSASIQTKVKKEATDEKKVYEMYYDYLERLTTLQAHRIMAIDRAEKEKVITASLVYDFDNLFEIAKEKYVNEETIAEELLNDAIEDGLKRLLLPSIENEIRSDLSQMAHDSSIEVFSKNLEKLLLQAPLKGRTVLGFDPGYYNGCKLAVIDATGKMLEVAKVFPFRNNADINDTNQILLKLINTHHVDIVAIGNGTASRESEKLIANLIHDNHLNCSYAIVSEAGASIWSAQEEARKEFPNLAVEERSAISIARRILDPLSELIKIDPKSIGVGQYQHDLPAKQLNTRLDEAIMKVTNRVGADLNTASVELLTHISGLNLASAKAIVKYRDENGKFNNREELLKVSRIKDKTFEQCAGFLRINNGDEILDQTSIHPEKYAITYQIMKLSNIEKLGQADIKFNDEKIKELNIDKYSLEDIKNAIRQPLRDYRDQFEAPLLKSDILEISDLKIDDELQGVVRNVTDFGAFVDIGLHDDGLVHISKMSMHKINSPYDILSVGQIIKVYVNDIDLSKNRVALSLLSKAQINQRDADYKHQKSSKDRKKYQKEEISMEEATKRLLDRFSKKH